MAQDALLPCTREYLSSKLCTQNKRVVVGTRIFKGWKVLNKQVHLQHFWVCVPPQTVADRKVEGSYRGYDGKKMILILN